MKVATFDFLFTTMAFIATVFLILLVVNGLYAYKFKNKPEPKVFYSDLSERINETDFSVTLILVRMFDVFFSLFVIINILAWLLPIISAAIFFSSKGPILFFQPRITITGKKVNLIKFRVIDMYKHGDTYHLTKVGHFLLRTGLSQMPMFFNVLIGQASVIGLTTLPSFFSGMIDDTIGFSTNRRISKVKPGIYSLFWANRTSQNTPFTDEIKAIWKADHYYAEHLSISFIIKLIYHKIISMLAGYTVTFHPPTSEEVLYSEERKMVKQH